MLVNKLHGLQTLITQKASTAGQWDKNLAVISKTWEDAAFSTVPHHSLRRYFNYQLEGLIVCSDSLSEHRATERHEGYQSVVLKQIDHLVLYYAPYFNWDAKAPAAYHQRLLGKLTPYIQLIRHDLDAAAISPALQQCLQHWLDQATESGASLRYTFRTLNYLENIVISLSAIDFQAEDAEASMILLFSRLNFNHLSFLAFRQTTLLGECRLIASTSDQLEFFQEQRAAILAYPEARELIYDPTFPSLRTMLGTWLQEQILLLEIALKKEQEARASRQSGKQSLDLSVAHLACLIKLFLEENIFLSGNTKKVFQFFATNFQTKRQTAISAGSLSKEFYSIDQHTAARVRDMLQKMIIRINRNFFPVMAAISTVALSHPGMH